MTRQSTSPQVRRVVLVPATSAGPASGRGDELVRRYRLARMRLEGRDGAAGLDRSAPRTGGGTLGEGCPT